MALRTVLVVPRVWPMLQHSLAGIGLPFLSCSYSHLSAGALAKQAPASNHPQTRPALPHCTPASLHTLPQDVGQGASRHAEEVSDAAKEKYRELQVGPDWQSNFCNDYFKEGCACCWWGPACND